MATIEQILGQDNGNMPDSLRQMYPKVNRNFNRLNTELTDHKADTSVHLTPTKDAKLAGIEEGAQVNQNAVSKINDVEASTPTDQFFIVGGLGITVSTNPTTKQITVTATGETAPAPHGETHNIGGADEIPDLEEALTKANLAEALVSELQTDLTGHIGETIVDGAHGLDGTIAKFKSGSGTFIDNDTSQTFTDAFCTPTSLVTVAITSATKPQGVWTVESNNGSFTITSTKDETDDITFDYYIQKAVI
ncbi:hypothetical protein J2Z32_003737 [Paenibacillus turicensis]|uniref:Uncharacterized protein n=1 Tax=Paenibacillus turicensis TaxID=160487 RepID=A0ABS4FWX2_9BACL|nr:hypothetical protein [Paenibacillus turicensis]MBP1907072.1 hypothetical protein [Paenibacillus turicensis]